MVTTERNGRRDAILVEDKPKFNVGKNLNFKNGKSKEVIKIYSKELQDITLGELEKMGYENARTFIGDWTESKGAFKVNKVIWIIEFKAERKKKKK